MVILEVSNLKLELEIEKEPKPPLVGQDDIGYEVSNDDIVMWELWGLRVRPQLQKVMLTCGRRNL